MCHRSLRAPADPRAAPARLRAAMRAVATQLLGRARASHAGPACVRRGASQKKALPQSSDPSRDSAAMRRVSEPEVIDLVSSDEEDDVVDVDDEGWAAVGGGRRATQQDEDDAALALRLQEEEYRGVAGGGAAAPPPAAAAAAAAALASEPVTELDWTRRHRAEQDAEYEASLAADRLREAQARAAAEAAAAEAAAASRAEAAAAKAEADAEAAARDAAAAKVSARERWLAASEPPAGNPGVISVALRFPDGAWLASRCLIVCDIRTAHS